MLSNDWHRNLSNRTVPWMLLGNFDQLKHNKQTKCQARSCSCANPGVMHLTRILQRPTSLIRMNCHVSGQPLSPVRRERDKRGWPTLEDQA